MGQDRNTQLASLYNDFPSTSTLRETSSELLLKVDHSIRLSSTTEYNLTLFIKILSSFPKTAPIATMPYCFRTIPITPPNVNPTEMAAYQWDPNASTLTEAVRNAFQNAADRWGPVAPPTMAGVSLQLSGETDTLLEDLTNNANCLDAYCYGMPIVKQMREASKQTLNEVERVANENVKLRPEVEELQREVQRMQAQLTQQVDQLQKASSNKLLTAVCTPEALVSTLEADARRLDGECRALGKQALAAHATDRRAFQDLIEQYKAKSKQMHLLDLKRRAYKSQALHS